MREHEITTRLPGGRGEPLLIVRDHGAWEQQVRDENRAKADEDIKDAVADIERGEQERKFARRPSLAEQKRSLDRIEAEYRRKREEPARIEAQLAALEAWAETAQAALPPEPDPEQVRRERDNDYSLGLQASMARARAAVCGHRSCMPGRCMYG
jgi:hypothetical protein